MAFLYASRSTPTDALRHLGMTHIDIPITPEKVWQVLNAKGAAA